jgi:hypothetical protein
MELLAFLVGTLTVALFAALWRIGDYLWRIMEVLQDVAAALDEKGDEK